MENTIVDFFIKNKAVLEPYFKEIHVNTAPTQLKDGWIIGENIKLVFYIYGKPDKTINTYEDKIKCLFNTDKNPDLEQQIKNIKDYSFHFSPYLQINENPVISAFQLTINLKSNERR